MKQIAFAFLIYMVATRCFAQHTEKEKVVMAYYSGFENHNWGAVAAQFADGFTFTSPNNDNHINIKQFKERCWGTSTFFKKVDFVNMTENGDDLFLLVNITTTDNKVVRNIDLYHFKAGKIQSIEVFFGRGEGYPGNKNPKKPRPIP